MAYVNQERKATLAAACKAALAKWTGVKWTLSVRNHSTIVMTIASGNIDFEADAVYSHQETTSVFRDGHADVNRHYVDRDWKGEARAFLAAAVEALSTGNHDRSDLQSDYFDVGWYVDIQIGRWNKPYVFTGTKAAPVEPGPAMAQGAAVHEAAAAVVSEPQACPVCGSTEDHTGLVCIRRPAEPARLLPARVKCVECGDPGPGDGSPTAARRHCWRDLGTDEVPAWHCAPCRARLTPADEGAAAAAREERQPARVTPIGTTLERMHAAALLIDPAVVQPPRFALVDAAEAESAAVRGALQVLTRAVESGSMPARAALEAIAHMAYAMGREAR